MKTSSFLYIGLFILVTANVALGQSSGQGDQGEKDPFKNDPFFSKPIQELLKKPGENKADRDTLVSKEIHHYVAHLNEEGLDFDGAMEAGPYRSSALYGLYPSLPMIHYNRVDALFLGIRQERMQWYHDDWLLGIPSINPHGMLGYSFGQKEWQYSFGLDKLMGRKRHFMLGAEYHNATTTDDYWRVGMIENSLTSFFGGYDFQDYYKQRGWGAYALFRTDRYFEGGVSFNDDRFNSLRKETNYALFGSGGRYRLNPPIDIIGNRSVDTLNVSSLAFSASFNPKRLVLSRNFTFTLTGTMEIGDPGINSSDYAYTKYLGEMVSYINLEQGTVFKYRLRLGTITGEAPLLKEFQLGGVGSLRAIPYKSLPAGGLGGNEMVLSNAELHFGSPEFGSSDWIDFDDFYITLFLDSGWIRYDDRLENRTGPFSGFSDFKFSDLRHNGGFGIGSSLIRCELAWDLNHASRAPVFWIRFNPTF